MNGEPLWPFLLSRLPEVSAKTLEHLYLTGLSTSIAVLLGIPMGIWITRQANIRGAVLGVAGIVQTIPSLAMLSFLLPILGIGAQPAIVALALYGFLPVVRNTYTGIANTPPETIEAADGLGFSNRQRLWLVEIPLALPVIVAGIRTAAVIGVGIATLSAFIGAGGLGDFINRGLAQTDTRLILLGAIPAAALALALDELIGLFEQLLRRGPGQASKVWLLLRGAVSILLIALLCFAGSIYGAGDSKDAGYDKDAAVIRIGSKNFTEQFILGEIMAQLIEAKTDLRAERVFNLGGTMICHGALLRDEIDLYAEYTGTALTAILNRRVVTDPKKAYEIVQLAYRNQFDCEWLAPFGFNNTYALAVRRKDAQQNSWKTIDNLTAAAPQLRAGFTAEFFERPDGYRGLADRYGLEFASAQDLDPGLMYQAIAAEEVDVICAFSTDGRIDAFELVTLDDNRNFFPPYFAAPVIRSELLAAHPKLRKALKPLTGLLDDETMRALNYAVDESKLPPAEVATQFLKEKGLVE